jgi:hypothetical protein
VKRTQTQCRLADLRFRFEYDLLEIKQGDSMSIRSTVSLCITGISLAGCATSYTPPTDGPTATLILSGSPVATAPNSGVKAVGGNTAFTLLDNAASCKGIATLGSGLKAEQSQNISIRANQLVVIKFTYGQFLPLAACDGAIQFIPESGATYSLRLDEDYFQKGQCMPKLQRKNPEGPQFSNVFFTRACAQKK